MFLYIQFIINLDFFEQTYLFEEKLHLKCALSNQTILILVVSLYCIFSNETPEKTFI